MSKVPDQEVIVDMLRRVTKEVFSTMLSLEVLADEAYTELQAQSGAEGVVSFIGLAGKCAGTCSLRCSSEGACRLASSFLMTEFESVNEEVLDAVAELTNMIIGNFKNQLEDRLGPMALSIPSVIHAHNFATGSLGREEWTVVPFQWNGNRLEIKVCLKDTEGKTGRSAPDSTEARGLCAEGVLQGYDDR